MQTTPETANREIKSKIRGVVARRGGPQVTLTRHVLFLYPLEKIYVEDDAQHALEYADLRAQTKGEEHQEEDARPERRSRQLHDRLCKHDESQPGALGGLKAVRRSIIILRDGFDGNAMRNYAAYSRCSVPRRGCTVSL